MLFAFVPPPPPLPEIILLVILCPGITVSRMVLCEAVNVDETTRDDTGDVVDGIAVELLLCWGIVGLVLLIVVDLVTLFV